MISAKQVDTTECLYFMDHTLYYASSAKREWLNILNKIKMTAVINI